VKCENDGLLNSTATINSGGTERWNGTITTMVCVCKCIKTDGSEGGSYCLI